MHNSGFDPIQFKSAQQQSWNIAAAGWQKWWKTFEASTQVVSDRLIELAGVRQGYRVLDLATGVGEPAISAAKIVGKTGHVTAIDASSAMLAIAEERARAAGLLDIVDFKLCDAEELELDTNQGFNAILCRWGLMFLLNLDNALSNFYNKLVSGGRLAAAVWPDPSRVPSINLPMTVVREQLKAPLPAPGIPGPFSLANLDILKTSLLKAGFKDIQSETVAVTFEFDSVEDYTKFNQDVATQVRAMLDNESEKRKEEIWQAVTNQAKIRFADQSGHVKVVNESICVVAVKE